MKDYYATLGVLDDVEDIIIRAAYKALAQRYHPDKWNGDKAFANQKMLDINEAYLVLSDPISRKKYDEEFKKNHPTNEAKDNCDYFEEFDDEFDEAWSIACDFYSDLQNSYLHLKRYDLVLANTFKTSILESKNFKNSIQLRLELERDFLIRYFGNDPHLVNFAKMLYSLNEKKVALRLNKIINAMGNAVGFDEIKSKLTKEFPSLKKLDYQAIKEELIYKLKQNYFDDLTTPDFEFLFKLCHSSNTFSSYLSDSKIRYRFISDYVHYDCDHIQMCLYLKQKLNLN